MNALETIADKVLIDHVLQLASSERLSQIELLKYLGELADRKLFLGLGFSSMWDFCRRALKFSASVSQQRILVAKATRKYPAMLEMLEDGRLTLCTAADLVPLLSDEHAEKVLALAAGKSRREIQNLDTGAGRKRVERDVIRRLGAEAPAPRATALKFKVPAAPTPVAPQAGGSVKKAPEPVSHRVAFSASADVVARLEKLQELLGGATIDEVVGKASAVVTSCVDRFRSAASTY